MKFIYLSSTSLKIRILEKCCEVKKFIMNYCAMNSSGKGVRCKGDTYSNSDRHYGSVWDLLILL